MSDVDNRSPEQIQSDIQHTRERLDDTISTIEERLQPGRLMERGIDYLRNNGASEYVSNLGQAVKEQPLPLALVGVGVAWMMMTSGRSRVAPAYRIGMDPALRSRAQSAEDDVSWRLSDGAAAVKDTARAVRDNVSGAADSVAGTARNAAEATRNKAMAVRDSVSGATDSITQSARDAAQKTRDMAQQTAQAFSGAAGAARERAGQIGAATRHGAERVRGAYDHLLNEQPLALGAIGLAVGAVLAALAPRTRQEDQLLGEASDRLTDEAKEAGREQLDKVKSAVVTAKDAVVDELKAKADGSAKDGDKSATRIGASGGAKIAPAVNASRPPSGSGSATSPTTTGAGSPGGFRSPAPPVAFPTSTGSQGASSAGSARSRLDGPLGETRPGHAPAATPSQSTYQPPASDGAPR